jgi:hypothetical protein
MSLINTLNNLAAATIKRHPHVDHGGCCVVAAHVGKRLQEKNIPVRIRVLNNPWMGNAPDLDEAREQISNSLDKWEWEQSDVDFYHVIVEFEYDGKKYAYDSTDGVREIDEVHHEDGVLLDGAMTVEEARALADVDDWNPMFNRDQVSTVRRRITRMLNSAVV